MWYFVVVASVLYCFEISRLLILYTHSWDNKLMTLLFVFQLSGLALLALGLVTRYYSTKTEELANKASGDAAGLAALAFIIIGGAVFIVSFFGCCGAIRESHCMITVVWHNNIFIHKNIHTEDKINCCVFEKKFFLCLIWSLS